MSIKLKRIASCLIIVCLTVAMLSVLTDITEKKSSVEKYFHFFEQDSDFDVLFMGSSKVINAVFPMELWNDYGIVSYNMGGHANAIPTSYWVLRNALKYTTPKCVVFDCYGSGVNSWIKEKYQYAHQSFDAFPLSLTKIQAIFDLVGPENDKKTQAIRMEMLWNFITYHNRWSEINLNDFHPWHTYQKGAEPRVNVSIPAKMAVVSPEKRNTLESRNMQYIIKTIELCQQRGIDILLVHMPYPATKGELIAANTVADVAETYDVDYLNFLTMDVVDYKTDMNDPNSHLNPSGAHKITDYLGRYLTERHGIPNQKNNPDYQSWHDDAQKYHQEKIDLFKNAACAWNYWMLLKDDDFSFVAELSQEDLQRDEVLAALLRNVDAEPEKVRGRCIIAADRISGEINYIEYETLLAGPVETALGTLSFDGECIRLDEQECWNTIKAGHSFASIRFALLDSTGKVVNTAFYSADKIRSEHAE